MGSCQLLALSFQPDIGLAPDVRPSWTEPGGARTGSTGGWFQVFWPGNRDAARAAGVQLVVAEARSFSIVTQLPQSL